MGSWRPQWRGCRSGCGVGGGLWGVGVKGGGIGWWEGGLCERFVLRWLLLLTYKRQAGKAHFLVYLGETSPALLASHTLFSVLEPLHVAGWAGRCADWASFVIRFFSVSVSR